VYLYLENLAEEIANKVYARFPGLVGEILEVVSKVLTEERDRAKEILEDLIEAEQGYLFTNDYDYLANRSDFKQGQTQKPSFVGELRIRIDQYFALVTRNIRDRVPRTIGYFLV
jgi:SpoVK/Ycf46/Vps4 family AAA+-type ATPase